jgi:hypothetical protein
LRIQFSVYAFCFIVSGCALHRPAPIFRQAVVPAYQVPEVVKYQAITPQRSQEDLRADYRPAVNKLDEKTYAFPNAHWGILAFGGDVGTEYEDASIRTLVRKTSELGPSTGTAFTGIWDHFAALPISSRYLVVEAGRYSVLFSKSGFNSVGFELDVPAGEFAEIAAPVLLPKIGSNGSEFPVVTEAPAPVSPPDREVFDEYPRSMVLKWTFVPGAVRYGLEVDFCFPDECTDKTAGRLLFKTNLEGPAFTTGFIGAQWGRWRAWGIGDDGRPGPKSKWSTFLFKK